MDIYSGKKVGGGVQFGRSGSSITFQDNHEVRTIQYCNHLGCSTAPDSQPVNPEKLKSRRPAFFSTGRTATVGSSSRAIIRLSDKRKPQQERQNAPFLQERVTLGASIREEQIEEFEPNIRQKAIVNLEVDPTSEGIQTVLPEPKDLRSSNFQGFSLNVNEASGNCQVTSTSRTRRPRYPLTGSGSQDASSSSSVGYSVAPTYVTHTFRPSQNQVTSAHRYGLKNLGCTSISDVLPSGCSSDVGLGKRMDTLRKIYSDVGSSSRSKGTVRPLTGRNLDAGESSSARSKGTIRSLTGGNPGSHRSYPSSASPSMLEHPSPQPTSRRTRNQLTSSDGVLLVRNQRVANGDGRTRLFEHVDDSTILQPETVVFPPPSQAQFSVSEAASATSSQPFSTTLASISQVSSGQSDSVNRFACTRRRADSEDNNIRGFRPWVQRDGYQRFGTEVIAEVLLALERIEQDEVLTYEELMVLESNLFSSGVRFHDRHRDMRMDIDNMSYEELLALEEKMGTVSTALTEEALTTCLKRSIYTRTLRLGISTHVDDDVKCSICQEEYNVGDEIGKLHCDHRYHMTCIHQWLRQKNWCPICKSSACPS